MVMTPDPPPPADPDETEATAQWRGAADVTWSVGMVSERLGISASTLRTWERRYGLGPTLRTSGGHRRYSALDIDRVDLMRRLLARGVTAQEAAKVAKRLVGDQAATPEILPSDDPTPDHRRLAEQFVEAAQSFDAPTLHQVAATALDTLGTVEAWDDVFVPAFVEIGERWADGRLGVEGEHLASSSVLSALRAHSRRQTLPELDRPASVIVASAEDDQHKLPVVALEAALCEHGISSIELGARLPASALEAVLTTVRPQVLFLWASMARPPRDPVIAVLDRLAADTTVVLAGPGWPVDVATVKGLHDTVEVVLSRVLAS
ncbi:hypothetical protein BHE97_02005 [Aeromicrobium sp. PE09-221]|uniref:MerR family transcriptional regulator n=1 Tax=Aeromicrobium sp. PE09-221 TaxID=1898043 RepID=UPI000B3E4CD0|nr:MerR family transcriptional regulator [Aeromicrobium sp. PE09-221]OUZ12503.1 hypothetical protein BHE97_02005 [Aeromicrobium sp. PE09-221]